MTEKYTAQTRWRMKNDGFSEFLKSYLGERSYPAAILDGKFTVIWANVESDGIFIDGRDIFPYLEESRNGTEFSANVFSKETITAFYPEVSSSKSKDIFGVSEYSMPFSVIVTPLNNGVYYTIEAVGRERTDEFFSRSYLRQRIVDAGRSFNASVGKLLHLAGCIDAVLIPEGVKIGGETDNFLEFEEKMFGICERLYSDTGNFTALFSPETFDSFEDRVNIKTVIEHILTEFKSKLPRRKILLSFPNTEENFTGKEKPVKSGSSEIDPYMMGVLPYFVPLSERKFTLLIMNLIQNAVIYSQEDSTISILLSLNEDFAEILIENRIPPNIKGRAGELLGFTPKYPKVSGNKRAGLGIPLAEKIVRSCGGELKIKNPKGIWCVSAKIPKDKKIPNYLRSPEIRYGNSRFGAVNLLLKDITFSEKYK